MSRASSKTTDEASGATLRSQSSLRSAPAWSAAHAELRIRDRHVARRLLLFQLRVVSGDRVGLRLDRRAEAREPADLATVCVAREPALALLIRDRGPP